MAAVSCALSFAQNHKNTVETVTKHKWETITVSGEGEGSLHYIR